MRCIVDRRWLGAALILKLKIPTVGHQAPKWRVVFIIIIVMVVMVMIVCQMSLSVNSDNYDHGVVMMRRVVVTISPIIWKTNYDHLGHFHQSSNWIQTFIVILFSGTMAFHKRLKSFRLNHHSDGHLQQNVAKSLYCLDSQTCKSKAKINCRDGIAVSVFLFVESDFQPIVMNRKLFWLVTSECPSSRIARIANLRQKLIATQLPSEQLPRWKALPVKCDLACR